LASGREVRATGNHRFLTYEGWTALDDLKIGDRLAAPRHVPAPENVTLWDDRDVVLLAQLMGDGSFLDGQPIRCASIDEANLTAVDDAAEHLGIVPTRGHYPAARATTLRLPARYRRTHGTRNPIAAWLDELGLFGARSHETFVPEPVFALPKRQIALLLRHLWATAGSVTVARTGPIGRIYYPTSSWRLADDLARLLWRFGIQARIKRTCKRGYRDRYDVDIDGIADQEAFCRVIGVHGARGEAVERFLAAIASRRANTEVDTVPREVWSQVSDLIAEGGTTHRESVPSLGTTFRESRAWKHAPSRERLARVAAVLEDEDLELLATNDVSWDSVTSIDSEGSEEVYDATVAGTHNFVANGIASHNSIEQDADMVILLHREDMYEKESPRAGEADFIVAKHRNGPTDTITVAFQGHYSRFVDMAT
jgi:replicative DNA helicase